MQTNLFSTMPMHPNPCLPAILLQYKNISTGSIILSLSETLVILVEKSFSNSTDMSSDWSGVACGLTVVLNKLSSGEQFSSSSKPLSYDV